MENSNTLPYVTQKPIIAYEMLEAIGEKVKTEIAKLNIDEIEATEENLSTIKNLRAGLNNNFKDLEERRKYIKSVVMKPYEDFDENYKKLIAVSFNNADSLLKSKASLVEDEILTKKKQGLVDYFKSKNTFDFLDFDDLGLKIIKSASDKSIKADIDSKLKQVENDLSVIKTLEHENRVFAKYQLTKDLNASISSVNIEVQKEKEILALEESKKAKQVEPKIIAPQPAEPAQSIKQEKKYKMSFSVVGTKDELKAIKDFMESKGIEYV